MHVAADYRLWIRDPETMFRANVDGTRDLLKLAREARVRRVVYTSSVATMAFRTDGIVVNEDTPVTINDMVGHYKRSKFLAEQQALAAAQDGQQVMILNPTTPIGPNDSKPTPTGRIFVDFLNHKFPAYVDTGAEPGGRRRGGADACGGSERGQAWTALHPGRGEPHAQADSGQDVGDYRYPVADDENSFRVIAATYAFFEEWITGRIRGKEPRATLEEVRMGRKKMFAPSARAQRELGFKILPVYPAMRAAIEWFRAHGNAP